MRDERGGIVTGWLLKLVLSLAIFGVVAFEAGAIVVAKVTIESVAGDVLSEAREAYRPAEDAEQAEKAARAVAERNDAVLESFDVVDNGSAIVVTVSKKAKTLLVHRIGFAEDWAIARSTRRRPVA
ncbi:MAG TPA: hypothetical protein VJ922_03135 [Actinomycetota bacterium]|nr:hypothetical protein [Actinomycetota bacterium]